MATLPEPIMPSRSIWDAYSDPNVSEDEFRAVVSAIYPQHEFLPAHEIGWARDYEIRGTR